MKLEEIKKAVDEGKTVHWATPAYTVIKGKYEYMIYCKSNDYYIGLNHQDGLTMNGKEAEFFIAE